MQASATRTPAYRAYIPWRERNGRFSPLGLAVLLAILAPGAHLAYGLLAGTLGAKPVTEVLHGTGDWAIRFLLLSLLVSPLRRVSGWGKLIGIRRMLGLAAAGYALAHLSLYVVDQSFDLAKVASEIVLRVYLTIGFVALLGLLALAATSTDGAIRRMGPTWHRLHRLTYAIAVLATVHFFLQSKADVTEAVLMAGFLVALFACRIAHKLGLRLTSPLVLAGIAVFAGLATAGIEYLWYALATGVPAERVLAANLDFRYSIRPAWWVFGVMLVVAALPLVLRLGSRARQAVAQGAPGRG
ncbi:sulfite oxidase heme-binding subunit YedZ [Stappia indica]|uniref:Protein-methionine-sulfoxide reductase heme-binding subunit MsrQ n=1 Tax=Stappia indica TaxID=538381 RepID=A0A857C8B2_9HYPH|nr:ferric reductase-like transmembrane domain-containing protein [Stappia indica]QGZ35151.1 sulfoxide reductase heme-binding subunit YedZ [Stappia indica]